MISYLIRLTQRLAATIPTATKDSCTPQLLATLYANATTSSSLCDLLTLTILVVLSLELLNKAAYHLPRPFVSSIPVRGKHLDVFSIKDLSFIGFNKALTGVFVYLYFGYLWSVRKLDCSCCGGGGIWSIDKLSLANTLLPLPALFVVYDFTYTLLHWFLHLQSVYKYIHKHHHRQKAPSRANVDAVNVHPVEFFLGEFNHLLALRLVTKGVPLSGFNGMEVSFAAAGLFLGIGGLLAGLNHTRHDVSLSTAATNDNNKDKKWCLYDSKHHDVHHRIPQCNYGQYTVLWDRIFGTFRDYDDKDRVNPAYQLDIVTGKTLESVKME